MAYWIMDDGSIQNKGLHLNTYGFTPQDIFLLKTTLEWQRDSRLPYVWIKYFVARRGCGSAAGAPPSAAESMELLRHNISQFMHNDMQYKINSDKLK